MDRDDTPGTLDSELNAEGSGGELGEAEGNWKGEEKEEKTRQS